MGLCTNWRVMWTIPRKHLGPLHRVLGMGMDKALPKLAEAYEKGLGTEVNQEQARLYRMRWSRLSR